MKRVRIGEHDYLQYKDGAPIRHVKEDRVEVAHIKENGEIHFCSFCHPQWHNDLKRELEGIA